MKKTNTQTLGEEIANAISHGIMALLGIIFLVLLLLKSNKTLEYVGASIFGFGMIFLYSMSTMYHALSHKGAKALFKRFDHLAIYILIGASFAPALLLIDSLQEPYLFNIGLGPILFIVQWLLIIVGVTFKAVLIDKLEKLHLFTYLLLGWSALIFVSELFHFSKGAFIYILLGGVSYTLGVIFYTLPKIKYFHFIWHLFVGLGTSLHFIAIYYYIY